MVGEQHLQRPPVSENGDRERRGEFDSAKAALVPQ
jgi:hypothetical protein